MTRNTTDFDQRIADWLETDPTTAPAEVLSTVVAAFPAIPQARRGPLAPWRFTLMNGTMRLASAAIVAVVAVGGALYLLRPDGGAGGTPSTSPPATVAPSPSRAATLSPAETIAPQSSTPVSFTSPLYGYTVSRPADWAVTAARLSWPEGDASSSSYMDSFEAPRQMSPDFDYAGVAAQPVPEGMTSDDWLLRHAQQQASSGRDCKGAVDEWTDAVVGSLEIRRVDLECEGGLRLSDVAFVVDGTGYIMSGNGKVIDQFLATFEPPN